MNKKVTITITFASLLLFALTTSTATMDTYDTTNGIGYIASTDRTKPVDPTDPTSPVTPENPVSNGVNSITAGPLSLDFVSSLDFGVQKITASDAIYEASAQVYTKEDGTKATGSNYVQITDNRGTFSGWILSAKQVNEFTTARGIKLKGAQVEFSIVTHVTTTAGTGVTIRESFVLIPGGGVIDLMSGTAAMDGEVNGTSGTHLLSFGDENSLKFNQVSHNHDGSAVVRSSTDSAATLFVPGKSGRVAAGYTTTVQWMLGDTPSQIVS
ncbi:MAG: WxL domain-containing protein [Lactobacillaceae bacterium]|jgi:hypothetical protein|nr:WxL domain-containing protein [Lactobacillaceae bacterium]